MAMEQKETALAVNIVILTHCVLTNVQKVNLVVQQEMEMDQAEEIVKERMIFASMMAVVNMQVRIIINKISKQFLISMIVMFPTKLLWPQVLL